MTYRELLYSVTFKDIILYLKHYHHTERLFDHKQHYDISLLKTYLKKYPNSIPTIKELFKIKKVFHKRVHKEMLHLRKRESRKYRERGVDPEPRSWHQWKRWVVKDKYERIVIANCEFVEYLHKGQLFVSPPPADELCRTLLNSPEVYIDTINTSCSYLLIIISIFGYKETT